MNAFASVFNPFKNAFISAFGAGASFTGALDGYTSGLAGVWSVRRRLLGSYTGPLIQVRRSSDNTVLDINAKSDGNLDTTALLSFCASGNGFVTKIYNQSTSLNMEQSTAASQPRIVSAGSLETLSGNPCLNVSTVNQFMVTPTTTTYNGSVLSGFVSARLTGTNNGRLLSATFNSLADFNANTRAALFMGAATGTELTAYRNTYMIGIASAATTLFQASSIWNGTIHRIRAGASSGSLASVGAFQINRYLIFAQADTIGNSTVGDKLIEVIIYTADKTSDEAAIRTLLA